MESSGCNRHPISFEKECRSCKKKRNRIERIRKGQCPYSVACTNKPAQGFQLCEQHRAETKWSKEKWAKGTENHSHSTGIQQGHRNTSSPQWNRVIWSIYGDNSKFQDGNTLAIQVFPDDHAALGIDRWLLEATQSDIGADAVVQSDDCFYIHQGLATIYAAKSEGSFSLVPVTWKRLTDQLQSVELKESCTKEKTVIFIHWTTEEPKNLDRIYDDIRWLNNFPDVTVRAYPSSSESYCERHKIEEIGILDEIAKNGPPEYSFRPTTCFGYGPCELPEHDVTVHKRTHSGSAAHVKVQTRDKRGGLTCFLESIGEQQKKRKNKTPSRSPHWFHQEFVPGLHKEEFRVFIATRRDANGIRHRKGYIVSVGHTVWDWDRGVLVTSSAQEDNFDGYGNLSLSKVTEHALRVFESLRARDDSLKRFETLEVGVRLDMGIAHCKEVYRSFGHEITRWPGAHYFSNNICAQPKTQICKAFATSFREYMEDGMSGIFA